MLLLALLDCRRATARARAPAPAAEDPALVIPDSLRVRYVAAARAVIDSVKASLPDTATVCVAFVQNGIRYRAEQSDLQRLSESRRRYVSGAECPRTYSRMIVTVDGQGRPVDPSPPGHIDPHHIEITLPGRWTNDRMDVDVSLIQGMHRKTYLCFTRVAGGAPAVACRHVGTWVS